MNNKIGRALEVLYRATLQVLYDQHRRGVPYTGIKEVRELLGIPPSPGGYPNDMVCHFLLHLQERRFAKYTPRDQWEITLEGISVIED